jgi:hypothetical protein
MRAYAVGPVERLANELGAVRERERGSEVGDAPLDDLVLSNARPEAHEDALLVAPDGT